MSFFFFNDPATTEIYTLSLHDALPISATPGPQPRGRRRARPVQLRLLGARREAPRDRAALRPPRDPGAVPGDEEPDRADRVDAHRRVRRVRREADRTVRRGVPWDRPTQQVGSAAGS